MSQDDDQYKLDCNQYKIIVESAPNMIWRAGRDALCDYFNTAWLRYTGRTLEQELGNGWAEGVHPEDLQRCLNIYMGCFEKRVPFEMVYRIKRFDGEYRWIHDKGTPYFDDSGEFRGYIGSCLDINEQITGETWKAMAQRDGLTGVWNRLFFEQEARRMINAANASKKRLSAVMLDIDGFKYFNDHYGHQLGDKVLISFTTVLKSSIRDTDLLGRYGGDEFILLLPDLGLQEAEMIVNRIIDRTAHPLCYSENSRIFLSFSHGVAELLSNDTYESLVDRADQAMYGEKNKKKQSTSVQEI